MSRLSIAATLLAISTSSIAAKPLDFDGLSRAIKQGKPISMALYLDECKGNLSIPFPVASTAMVKAIAVAADMVISFSDTTYTSKDPNYSGQLIMLQSNYQMTKGDELKIDIEGFNPKTFESLGKLYHFSCEMKKAVRFFDVAQG